MAKSIEDDLKELLERHTAEADNEKAVKKKPNIKSAQVIYEDKDEKFNASNIDGALDGWKNAIIGCPLLSLFERYALKQQVGNITPQTCFINHKIAHPIKYRICFYGDLFLHVILYFVLTWIVFIVITKTFSIDFCGFL